MIPSKIDSRKHFGFPARGSYFERYKKKRVYSPDNAYHSSSIASELSGNLHLGIKRMRIRSKALPSSFYLPLRNCR